MTIHKNSEIARNYTIDKWSMRAIADHHRISEKQVKSVLTECGITCRSNGPHVEDLADIVNTIADMRDAHKTWAEIGTVVSRHASTAHRLFYKHRDLVRS